MGRFRWMPSLDEMEEVSVVNDTTFPNKRRSFTAFQQCQPGPPLLHYF